MSFTILEVYSATVRSLLAASLPSSVTDALELVQAVWPGGTLSDPQPLDDEAVKRLEKLTAGRAAGEPVAYLTGRVRFMGRDFQVSRDVLIPRNRTTATLVRAAVQQLQAKLRCGGDQNLWVADIGTGAGNVLLSVISDLASERVHGLGIDRSVKALDAARTNAERLRVHSGRIFWVQGDLATGLQGPVDLLCANLPYVPQIAQHLRFEPTFALQGQDMDGLGLYRKLIADVPRILHDDGVFCYEVPPSQASEGFKLAQSNFASVDLVLDDWGVPRAVIARRQLGTTRRNGYRCH